MTPSSRARTTTILIVVIQALVGLAVTYWVGRVEGINARLETHSAWAAEKVISFEGRTTSNEERSEEILRRLDRIETKLDRLEHPKIK